MEERLAEATKEIGEMRKMKEMEGKIYVIKERGGRKKGMEKRIENLEEEN